MKSLIGLNPEQRQAVEFIDGPALVFAGAGSGKTKVLTHKLAYLIENRVFAPEQLLAVTFTNKAANELRERVARFVGPLAQKIQIGTFHSICARILRREIRHLGLSAQFTIYDEDDQQTLLKKIIAENSIMLEGVQPHAILSRISFLKNQMIDPQAFEPRKGNPVDKLIPILFPKYLAGLRRMEALDFDDLLLLPLELYRRFPEVLERYRRQYRYILVDEYQDTNRPQFQLVEMLGKLHQRVCVVGDDDQSIYSWRGADIENILRFDQVFPTCRVFKLEQNYRSTNNILRAASAVVNHNTTRAVKTLWSEKDDGDLLVAIEAANEHDEAALIVSQIQKEIRQHKRNFKDFALLYRTNAQSRVLEEILRRNNIVYTVVGGVRFYERKEVKDVLAYFRLFCNPKDDINFRRIINFPPRGIGKTTLQILEDFARSRDLALYEALAHAEFMEISKRASQALMQFSQMIQHARELRKSISFEEWASVMIVNLDLRNYYKEMIDEESRERLANIDELLNDISEYCHNNPEATLENYLENVALNTQIDNWEDQKNAVSLMTLHSAKGLEFPVVFICGLNQGLFPLERDPSPKALEEERRLFYVGLTRAREKIFLSSAQMRSFAGDSFFAPPSMFLREVPADLIQPVTAREGVISVRSGRASNPVRQPKAHQSASTHAITDHTVGHKVEHSLFGVGTIIEVEGYGSSARLKIRFNNGGIKTIVAKFVKTISKSS